MLGSDPPTQSLNNRSHEQNPRSTSGPAERLWSTS